MHRHHDNVADSDKLSFFYLFIFLVQTRSKRCTYTGHILTSYIIYFSTQYLCSCGWYRFAVMAISVPRGPLR